MGTRRWTIILLGACLASVVAVAPARAADCPVFLLARGGDGVTIETENVPDGEVRVWSAGAGTEVMDLVLPVGLGGSGSVLNGGETVLYVVRCTGSGIAVQLRYPNGRQVDRPVRTLEELRGQDIRVSVVLGTGERKAFVVEAYDRVMEDRGGPVQNLLADAIPLTAGDVAVTTDTYPRRPTVASSPSSGAPGEATLVGAVELDVSGHLFARGTVPGRQPEWFLIDTGGAGNMVARSVLPEGLEVEPSHTLEYSSSGVRELDYAPGGATGSVVGVLGHATLPRLTVGTVELEDAEVSVVDSLPDIFDRPVAGILGIDFMERAGRVIFRLPAGAKGTGRLELAPAGASAADPEEGAFDVPFTVVNRHLTLPATLGEHPAHFLLDTGAPGVMLDQQTATMAGVLDRGTRPDVGGLDGGKAASSACEIPRLTVGKATVEAVPCRSASLSVFAPFRGGEEGIGLLGNAFLGRFERVEIDFSRGAVHFVPRHAEASAD